MRNRVLPLVIVSVVFAAAICRAADTPQTAPLPCSEIARRVAEDLPELHLLHYQMDDRISGRAWTNYLASLDSEHVFFFAADIQRFRDHEHTLDDELKDGSVDFAFAVTQLFKQRVSERCAYVSDLLQKKFDLDREEYYRWKRDDAPWPASEAEMNETWRKRVKNEYVRGLIAEETGGDSGRESAAKDTDTGAARDAGAEVADAIRERYEQMLTVLQDSDKEWVLQTYLSAFANAYDPHSDYMPASAVEDFGIEMRLSLVGIGALLRSEDGAARVVRIIPGGPADHDTREIRLVPGDKIIAVAQEEQPKVNILHWPLHRVVRLIRGEKGTRVILTVIPASDPTGSTTKTVDLVRDEVKLEEQAARWEIREAAGDDEVRRRLAVVTVPAFYGTMGVRSANDPDFRSVAADVRDLLAEARKERVEGVILDLRNNGGGSLLEAIRMVGLFIGTGPVVQVRERNRVRIFPDRDPSIAFAGPLVVLVNRLSASA